MATQAVPRVSLGLERRFFLGMAVALAICTFLGFARSYYLMQFTDARPLTWLVHVHGVLFTAWVLLFGLQAGLISARRHDVHVVTGVAGAALAVAMIALGLAVAIIAPRPPNLPFTREQFLIIPLITISLFALFVGLAFANRHRSDYHKRFMLVATINVIVPALSRMTAFLPFLPRGVLGALIIMNVFLIALMIYDWRALGKVHRATLIGVGVTVFCEPLRFLVARSDWWPEIARSLLL